MDIKQAESPSTSEQIKLTKELQAIYRRKRQCRLIAYLSGALGFLGIILLWRDLFIGVALVGLLVSASALVASTFALSHTIIPLIRIQTRLDELREAEGEKS